MKAAKARRLATQVKAGKVKPLSPLSEVDVLLQEIKIRAGMGELFAYVDVDLLLESSSVDEMETLGYELEYIQTRPTARPKWRVSWERKAA